MSIKAPAGDKVKNIENESDTETNWRKLEKKNNMFLKTAESYDKYKNI